MVRKSFSSHLIFCLLTFFLWGCAGKKDESAPAKIQLRDLDGKQIDLDEFKGSAVFINFWATWCAPCIAEMPSIQRVKDTLAGKNIKFILASAESADLITAFKERKKSDLQFVQSLNQDELLIQVLPTTYIIDPNGELVFSEGGRREWDSPESIELLTKIIEANE